MHVIAGFTVIALGVGVSASPYVAEIERYLATTGLNFELHANGTNIEGEWDAVLAAIKGCHERLHALGVPRIQTTVSLGTRTDKVQRMADKVASVKAKLEA
nr:MTH1187 family thiamine-binding protein [uncultured Holophaga sp.]